MMIGRPEDFAAREWGKNHRHDPDETEELVMIELGPTGVTYYLVERFIESQEIETSELVSFERASAALADRTPSEIVFTFGGKTYLADTDFDEPGYELRRPVKSGAAS